MNRRRNLTLTVALVVGVALGACIWVALIRSSARAPSPREHEHMTMPSKRDACCFLGHKWRGKDHIEFAEECAKNRA